jgi:hypothetical protein
MCSLLDELDLAEATISDLSQSLTTAARRAFRQAAIAALSHLNPVGAGNAYRVLASIQPDFFSPPDNLRARWDITQDPRTSKLHRQPAIEHARCGPGGRPLKGT